VAKKIVALVKLQIPAGQANPAPPVGPALGQRGVNIMEFCKAFNAKTQGGNGMLTPVIITVYSDKYNRNTRQRSIEPGVDVLPRRGE